MRCRSDAPESTARVSQPRSLSATGGASGLVSYMLAVLSRKMWVTSPLHAVHHRVPVALVDRLIDHFNRTTQSHHPRANSAASNPGHACLLQTLPGAWTATRAQA